MASKLRLMALALGTVGDALLIFSAWMAWRPLAPLVAGVSLLCAARGFFAAANASAPPKEKEPKQ